MQPKAKKRKIFIYKKLLAKPFFGVLFFFYEGYKVEYTNGRERQRQRERMGFGVRGSNDRFIKN